jgi:acetyltransferase
VVTAQAGPGLLLLDDLRGRRARVPELTTVTQARLAELLPPLTFQRNPVDTGRPGPEFGRVLAAVAVDPGVDVIAGYALHEPEAVDLVAAAQQGRTAEVPMILGLGGVGAEVVRARSALLEAGIAVAADPRGVAAATAALLADARVQARGQQPTVCTNAPTGINGAYDEHEAKQLLNRLGIATPPSRACTDRASAHAALSELGGPVAVKILDAAVLHKTEVGGVHLGITTPEGLDAALDRLDAIGAPGYLVEAMAPSGIDLVVGARRDPVFGPVVLLGLGGTTAEVLADVAIRLAPLAPVQAAAMPADLAAHALLTGWRGGPVLDAEELGRVVASLGDLLTANPELEDIEVNPLRLTDDGLIALDAVVITRQSKEAGEDAKPHL